MSSGSSPSGDWTVLLPRSACRLVVLVVVAVLVVGAGVEGKKLKLVAIIESNYKATVGRENSKYVQVAKYPVAFAEASTSLMGLKIDSSSYSEPNESSDNIVDIEATLRTFLLLQRRDAMKASTSPSSGAVRLPDSGSVWDLIVSC